MHRCVRIKLSSRLNGLGKLSIANAAMQRFWAIMFPTGTSLLSTLFDAYFDETWFINNISNIFGWIISVYFSEQWNRICWHVSMREEYNGRLRSQTILTFNSDQIDWDWLRFSHWDWLRLIEISHWTWILITLMFWSSPHPKWSQSTPRNVMPSPRNIFPNLMMQNMQKNVHNSDICEHFSQLWTGNRKVCCL